MHTESFLSSTTGMPRRCPSLLHSAWLVPDAHPNLHLPDYFICPAALLTRAWICPGCPTLVLIFVCVQYASLLALLF